MNTLAKRLLLLTALTIALVVLPVMALAADVWDGTVATGFAGGDGTKENPYQIATAEQLAYLNSASKSKYFVLTADIDLDNREWTPITGFGGHFDGADHTISNLKITSDKQYVGFFSGVSGTVTNVKFNNAEVSGAGCVAVVCGTAGSNNSLLQNIKVTGLIKVSSSGDGSNYARAAVIAGGWCYGTYSNCVVIGDDGSFVKYTGSGDGRYCAGIVGHADDVAKYENCWVENIEITGGWLCGGIAGPGPADAEVSGCTVKDVTINASYSGGLFGWFYDGGDPTVEGCVVENLNMTETSGSGVFGGYNDDIGIDMSSNYSVANQELPNSSQSAAAKTGTIAITDNSNPYSPKRLYFDSLNEAIEALGEEGGVITVFDHQVLEGELPSNIQIDSRNGAEIVIKPIGGFIMTYPGTTDELHTGVTFTGSDLGFRSQVPLYFGGESTFRSVSISKDGELIADQPKEDVDFSVTEGSTLVTLYAHYLMRLESGTYQIAITSNLNGEEITVDTTFTIPAPATDIPRTGDNSPLALFAALMVLSATGMLFLRKRSFR